VPVQPTNRRTPQQPRSAIKLFLRQATTLIWKASASPKRRKSMCNRPMCWLVRSPNSTLGLSRRLHSARRL